MTGAGRPLGGGRLFSRQDKDGKWWVLNWRDSSKNRKSKRLSKDKRTAERMRAKIIRERDLALQGLADELGQDRLLRDVVATYLDRLAKKRRPLYVASVRSHLDRLTAIWGHIEIRRLSKEMVTGRRDHRIEEGASIRTANMEIGSLRTCLNWAVRDGIIGSNPLKSVAQLPIEEEDLKKRRRALAPKEIEKFVKAAREDDVHRANRFTAPMIPQSPMWLTLLERGPRWGGVAGAEWRDFDAKRKTLLIRATTTKSKKTRTIPLPGYLAAEVDDLRGFYREMGITAGDTDAIFLSPTGKEWRRRGGSRRALTMFERLLELAGVAKVDAAGRSLDIHALRGTAATRLLRHGVDVMVLIELFGWSDLSMLLKHYSDLRVDDLKSALTKVPQAGTGEVVTTKRRSAPSVAKRRLG